MKAWPEPPGTSLLGHLKSRLTLQLPQALWKDMHNVLSQVAAQPRKRKGHTLAPSLYAGSLCSGSRMGRFTVEAVTDMICDAAGGDRIDVWHAFVCEYDPANQKWLDTCEQYRASIIIVAFVSFPLYLL